MNIQNNSSNQNTHIVLAKVARRLNPYIDALLISIPLAALLDVFANIISPFVPELLTDYLKSLSTWGLHNGFLALALFVILLLIRALFFVLKDVPIPPSYRELEKSYLKITKTMTEFLIPEGLPTDISGHSARLEKIFYPPKFYPCPTMTDIPLTDLHDENNKVDFVSIWNGLTEERPVAIILGDPGMGKSTLLAGLTLHMTMRRQNRTQQIVSKLPFYSFAPFFRTARTSSTIYSLDAFQHIHLLLVPILLDLREYAQYIDDGHKDTTFCNYLKERWGIHFSLLEIRLRDGKCIVLLNGLDEVKKDKRKRVQRDIIVFINQHRNSRFFNFNRFIITSRTACFDHNAFPEVQCYSYSIAPLDKMRIEKLLEDLFHAFVSNDRSFQDGQQIIIDGLKSKVQDFSKAIENNLPIAELARNPLLLYLLAVVLFREEKVNLPRQRIELYEVVTKLLLEGHSESRHLSPIEESLAISYLGALAVKMQAEQRTLLDHADVVRSLMQSMNTHVEKEAEEFLVQVRERSGLFCLRVDDDKYGFYHQTFQEYFAARYLIRDISQNRFRAHRVRELVNKGCSLTPDKIWREPFLLAIAYLSRKDKYIANQILEKLLDEFHQHADSESKHNIISLAHDCLLEVKASTVKDQLSKAITTLYEKTLEEAKLLIEN